MPARLVTFVLVAVLSTSGCSLAFVRGPADPPIDPMPMECTTSRVWPIADVLFTLQFGLGAIGATIDRNKNRLRAPIAILAVALGFAASSVVGFYRVSNCRGAQDAPAS